MPNFLLSLSKYSGVTKSFQAPKKFKTIPVIVAGFNNGKMTLKNS